jgi:hypothetical protein
MDENGGLRSLRWRFESSWGRGDRGEMASRQVVALQLGVRVPPISQMIEDYKFGKIKIFGKEYNFDVEVRWTGEVFSWWRKEGHTVNSEDVERALKENPEVIIIGTGAYGVCKITKDCEDFIKEKGLELIVDITEKAVEKFNELLKQSKKVIGFFHLTC